MPRKRKRAIRPCSRQKKIRDRLIRLKVQCNFSAKQLKAIIDNKVEEPAERKLIAKLVSRHLRQNYSAYRLHGCKQCDNFIWIVGENHPCAFCHNQEGRLVLISFFYLFTRFCVSPQHCVVHIQI